MQNNKFASFTGSTSAPTLVFGGGDYQDRSEGGFQWISLSAWTPTEEDFLEQAENGGHCCVIANATGLADFDTRSDSGEPVGVTITDNSQLTEIDVCHNLYQAQRNIVIVPIAKGGKSGKKITQFSFLSGGPRQREPLKTTIAVTALEQGAQIDPVLLKVLATGPYAGLPLKPASAAPKSLRVAKHEHHHWNNWLAKIIHEAEEFIEELLGLDNHPFGGGHQLHLSLPPQGLQPLNLTLDFDPDEPQGTVHAIDITQTDANGARGGIRAAFVIV